MKSIFDFSEEEFDKVQLKYGSVGKFKSINNKHEIEILSKERSGTAGLAYVFPCIVDGVKCDLPFPYIRKLHLELPKDYNYLVCFDLIQQYKNETK